MSTSGLTPELKALAGAALAHQNAGEFAMAAQKYAALLEQAPHLWPACYNLALVYQHLQRLPEAAEMYARTLRLNPSFAEGYNNLGNVLKELKNHNAAIDAFRHALSLNPQLAEAAYNLAIMQQAQGQSSESVDTLRQAVASNPSHSNAWDALYRALLGLGRQQEAIQAFIDWENAAEMSPEMVVAGLALCRFMGDRVRENRYVGLALSWPFANCTPEQFAPILGMIQYFDISRENLLSCYRRYDAAVVSAHPVAVTLLSKRAAGEHLRIGYVSGDFRQHVLGRMMLDVMARHDRTRFSILLISTCPSSRHDAVTAEYRRIADGFADISELDDFSAAKTIAEADIDVLVDLAGHTNSARPGIYAHRPARNIITHLGYHGCLGMSAVDYKLTDRVADLDDAAMFQIEKPYVLETGIFPWVHTPPSRSDAPLSGDLKLDGKFVFGAFLNLLKLSPRCLSLWARVLDAVPEAILLFSPLDRGEQPSIERAISAAGIASSRIAVLHTAHDDASLRSRYRLVHAVMDTCPYAGGDTTLAALDMGVPVVTLAGKRHSERVGASILTQVGMAELIAETDDTFVALAVRLARDAAFMASSREKIAAAKEAAKAGAGAYTRALESAFVDIVARKPSAGSMTLGAHVFFQTLHAAMRRQANAINDVERREIASIFVELRKEQSDYPPLLRAQFQLAQELKDLRLASDCLTALLELFPDDLDSRLMLAGFLIDQGNATDALRVLDDVSAVAGNPLGVRKLQLRAHAQLKQWLDARQCSEAVIAETPDDAQAWFWHGTVLSHLGEIDSALTFLNRALILSPNHAEAAYNAGVLLAEMGNHHDAEKVFRRALGAAALPSAHVRLLQALRAQGRQEAWLTEAQRFVYNQPGLDYARLLESRIARHRGDLQREMEILLPLAERTAALDDNAVAIELAAELLAILPSHDVSPRLLKHLDARFNQAANALFPGKTAATMAEPSAAGPLRLGLLADFSLPYVSHLVVELASRVDGDRFSLTIFVVSPSSLTPTPLASRSGSVVSLAALDEFRSADIIRGEEIHVLMDACAFGAFAKPGILALRPAKLLIALPGFSHTVGIGTLDFRLTDRLLDLGTEQDEPTTVPICMDEGCVYPVFTAAPDSVPVTRDSLGIDRLAPVFGVHASLEKLSARCLALWTSLAERVPDSVFVIDPVNQHEINSIRNVLTVAGIAGARLFSPPMRAPETIDTTFAGVIDIVLDTLPASDYRSVRCALLAGIPVITLAGRMADERVGLTIMGHLGDRSTVAETGREYVDIAVKLATAPPERAALSGRLQALWKEASAADKPFSMNHYTRRLEAVVSRAAEAPLPSRLIPAT